MTDLVVPGRSCVSCKFFVPPNGPNVQFGECHAHPPFMTVFVGPPTPDAPNRPSTFNVISFPQVSEASWCGEHKPKVHGLN